ncbi:MAG: endolytic transglycosylase MltG [Candidatus Eremiobacteraeota bacterium]|nr:endolytic transglycosylase MltG [Candidatus Eremiobacteraeota bacterium]
MRRVILAFLGLGVFGCAILAGAFWYASYGDRSKPVEPTQIVIQRGSTFSSIARALAQSGVIDSALAFRMLARLRHEDVDVHAGAYRFPARQSANDVLHALLTGGAQIAAWVSIPEGFTAEQIAKRLQQAGVGQESSLARNFLTTPLTVDGTRTKNLEGYLFPSTYLVSLDASPQQIQKQMTDEFFKELPADASSRARQLRVSVPAAVVVASLVEREAKVDADRSMIAGVIYNRLRVHMPLQVDATIEYALPSHKTELLYSDLKIDSPYNTYVHEGLPPTPIANPGKPSLEAAFHPAKTDMLYYVYCGNGRHVFAKTLSEHQANVARCLH